jgi:hypothetical protein
LDSADPELAWYVLDLHKLGLKNIMVAPDDPTRIVHFRSLSLPINHNTSLAGARTWVVWQFEDPCCPV